MFEKNFSADEHIRKLFSETDENGYLCIPAWHYDNVDEEGLYYSCAMDWNEGKSGKLTNDFCDFERNIRKIAAIQESEKMTEEQRVFGDTYLKPFSAEIDQEIEEKIFAGEEITEEEKSAYDAYKHAIYEEAAERLGNNDFSYDVIIRCQRFFKLLELNAPEAVLSRELRELCEAFIMFHCCTELTVIRGVVD